MGLQFTVDVDNSRIGVYRNPLLWTLRILVDGKVVVKDYPWWPKRVRSYAFAVGRHNAVVEHMQPSWPGGFRLQMYRVYVDGERVREAGAY